MPLTPGNFDGGNVPVVFPVTEWGPGVEAVQWSPELGSPVLLAHEYGPGVKPVFFVGGLPLHLDPAWQAQQAAMQAKAATLVDGPHVAEEERLANQLLLLG